MGFELRADYSLAPLPAGRRNRVICIRCKRLAERVRVRPSLTARALCVNTMLRLAAAKDEMPDTLIVVPCFNEADRLDTVAVERFAAEHADVGFILVDDGSTDATGALIEGLASKSPGAFTALRMPHNVGKAEAVRTGMNKAFAMDAAVAGYWDADFSTPLDEIALLRTVLRDRPEVVAVLGSRVRRLGADIRRRAVRHYLGRIFATLASLALEMAVYDTQCGAKLFRVCDPVRRAFAEPFLSRWIFDVELLARLRLELAAGEGRISDGFYELPLRAWQDVAGSKLKGGHMVEALLDLARIAWRYRHDSRRR